MRDKTTSPTLHMVWIKVRDDRGRTHMEARWVHDSAAADATPHAA